MNYVEISRKVSEAVYAHDEAFYQKHKDCLDFGHCGSAVVLLSFGRKRKIKNDFIEADLISENRTWSSYGHKEYVFSLPSSIIPTQYMEFYVNRAKAAVDVLREELDGSGVEVNLHSWVD